MEILHIELGAKECENRIQNFKIEYDIKNDEDEIWSRCLNLKFEAEV